MLGLAVIGAGYWGPNLVRNICFAKGCELRWLCDLELDRAESVAAPYRDVRATSDLDDVLNDDAVSAVVIATPAATHAPLARRCLTAGRHILVEKPLAASADDARQIVELGAAHDLTVMCDHTFCYTPVVRHIGSLVAAGELGTVQYFDSVRINLGIVQPDIDVFWDLAPHDLSILDFILPDDVRPKAVAAHGADPIGAGRSCVGYVAMPLTSGGVAHLHVNWLSPVKVRTTILGGSLRTLVWDDNNPAQRLSVFDRGVDLSATSDTEERRRTLVSYRSGDMVAPALPATEALQNVITEFKRAIETHTPPATDGWSGLRVVQILEGIDASLASGGTIPLD